MKIGNADFAEIDQLEVLLLLIKIRNWPIKLKVIPSVHWEMLQHGQYKDWSEVTGKKLRKESKIIMQNILLNQDNYAVILSIIIDIHIQYTHHHLGIVYALFFSLFSNSTLFLFAFSSNTYCIFSKSSSFILYLSKMTLSFTSCFFISICSFYNNSFIFFIFKLKLRIFAL